MPSEFVYDAAGCWDHWIFNHRTIANQLGLLAPANRGERLANINEYFETFPGALHHENQFKRDTGFWFGAMVAPGTAQRTTIQKLFSILHYGGLMVRRFETWYTWQSLHIPIAAAISHSARVLVQLPRENPHAPNSNIWGWLTADNSIQKRGAATHGIEVATTHATAAMILAPEVIARGGGTMAAIPPPPRPRVEEVNGLPKYVKELKGNLQPGEHYYTKVALGGHGFTNPFSGNPIDAEGKHGHLYLCYRAPTLEDVGGLLIGTEQSAPADQALRGANPITVGVAAVKGIEDQVGGKHDLGIFKNKYSATGGNEWKQDPPNRLNGIGPHKYYDGMYVDLSLPYQYNHVLDNWQLFSAAMLGWTGEEPPMDPAPPPGPPPRPVAAAPLHRPPGRNPQGRSNLRDARR